VEVALYAGRADPVPPETECELRAASEERSPSPPPRPAAAPTPRPAPPRAPSLRRDVAPARAAPPATVAERIRQTAPAQPIVRAPTEIGPLPPAPTPIPMPPAPRKPSDLARQVASYRAARALSGVDDRRALARWRDLSARWPDSPLEPEVEVQIVNALLRLGRRDEALTAAREILRRRPDSSRAAELRALVTAGGGAK
jgi:hypothetical protein